MGRGETGKGEVASAREIQSDVAEAWGDAGAVGTGESTSGEFPGTTRAREKATGCNVLTAVGE